MFRAELLRILRSLYAHHRKFKVLSTPEELLSAVLDPNYSHRNRDERLRLLFKTYEPSKKRGETWKHYLLRLVGYKQCNTCGEILLHENFSIEHRSGWQSECKTCRNEYTSQWQKDNKAKVNSKTRAYQAKKARALPPWADLSAIAEFYDKCPEGYEVDHVVPIAGRYVCGLHTLENLQYLTITENRRKSNKYE